MRDLALPASIGLFFQTMYNIVDSFYAGNISTLALAALGLSFPVFLLIIATSGGLSRGSSALIANSIGSRDEAKQDKYIAQSFSIGLIVSALLVMAGMFLTQPLFQMLGAEGEYLANAMAYMTPIFIGAPFFVLSNLCNAMLVASGDSRTFSRVLVIGFFLNLIFDPWFLYGGYGVPAMGIAGIAWATVVIQGAGCSYMIYCVLKRGLLKVIPLRRLLPDLRTYWEIAYQAVPASFNILQVAISFFVITYFLKTYGEASVAAFGVTTRIEQIGLLPALGLSAAIMALVGQNNGAARYDRIGKTMWVANRAGLIINTMTSLVMFFFARQLMQVFTDDAEVIDLGVTCLRVIAPIQWSYVMTAFYLAMLRALKRPMYAFFESMLRKVILPAPLFYLFVWQWKYEIEWIWYTVVVTNVLMTIVTISYGQYVLRKLGVEE